MQPQNHKLTVERWLTKWLQTQENVRGLGDGTIIDYRRHVDKYWIPAIGQIRFSELKPSDVTDTLAFLVTQRARARDEALEHNRTATAEAAELDKARVAKGFKRPIKPNLVSVPLRLNAGTVQRIHATLRAALNAAVRAEEADRNVAAQADKPQYRRKKVKPWQPEQLGQWLDSITGFRMYPLFHLSAFAGMRRGELIGLSWDDVDLDNAQVTVYWQITLVSAAQA
jgi:integrase